MIEGHVDRRDLARLERRLKRIDPRPMGKVLRKAAKEGCWQVARAARSLSPGGGLKRGIKPRKARAKGWDSYKVGGAQMQASPGKHYDGAGGRKISAGLVAYFHDVGYTPGLRSGAHRSTQGPTSVPGKGFVRKAFERVRHAVLPAFVAKAKQELHKLVKK